MAQIIFGFPLSHDALASLKRALHERMPNVKSSHLAEAIARGFGCQTNAALQVRLHDSPGAPGEFDGGAFLARLVEFHYSAAPDVTDEVKLVITTSSAGPDAGLSPRSPLDRCAAYGVQIKRTTSGQVFAHHTVGGVVGPARDEHEAAQLACNAWSI